MNNLGYYYQYIEYNYDLMKKYYLMSIKKGFSNAMYNLGYYYEKEENNYKLMKKYYLMAIKKR
jgi:TPR repeat protein